MLVTGVCLRALDMAIVLDVCPPYSRPCSGTVSWTHLGHMAVTEGLFRSSIVGGKTDQCAIQ